MVDKICPCCGQSKIQDWETVCNSCYRLIGELDKKYGTTYQKAISEGKFVLIQNVKFEQVGVFYPLSYEERMERARRLAKFCISCQMKIEQKCEDCIWYKLMNSITGVDPW